MKKELPEDLKIPKLPVRERVSAFGATLALFLILVVASLPALEGAGRELDYLKNLRRFAGQFFPPDFSVAPQILSALGETVQIAVMATFFAVILALPLAVAGAARVSERSLRRRRARPAPNRAAAAGPGAGAAR